MKIVTSNTLFFIAKFIFNIIYRTVYFGPIFFSAHLPYVVPNPMAMDESYRYLLIFFSVFIILQRSFFSARVKKTGTHLQLAYYAMCLYVAALWYPMWHVAHTQYPWFFPLLLIVTLYSAQDAFCSSRPLASVVAIQFLMPAVASYFIATATFTLTLKCDQYQPNHPALHYYVNSCDIDDQIIPKSEYLKQIGANDRKIIHRWYRTVTPIGDRIFIGATGHYSFAYNLKTKRIEQLRPRRGIFFALHDKVNDRVFLAANWARNMRVYDNRTLKLLKFYDLDKVGPPFWLMLDEISRRLFVGFDFVKHDRVRVYDPKTLRLLKRDNLGLTDGGMVEASIDHGRQRVYFAVLFVTTGQNILGVYDMKSLRMTQSIKMPGYVLDMYYSKTLDDVFAATPISGLNYAEILRLDEKTLRTVERMRVPIGTRDIETDSNGVMYVSNYMNGYIYMIDWKQKKIIAKMSVGRKIKRMFYVPEMDALFFTSEQGYMRIDLKDWKKSVGKAEAGV